jgi:hypothetical protein
MMLVAPRRRSPTMAASAVKATARISAADVIL